MKEREMDRDLTHTRRGELRVVENSALWMASCGRVAQIAEKRGELTVYSADCISAAPTEAPRPEAS